MCDSLISKALSVFEMRTLVAAVVAAVVTLSALNRNSNSSFNKKLSAVPSADSDDDWVVPFNRPDVSEKETDYVREAVATGAHSQSDHAQKAQAWLMRETGKEALLTPSCSAALEMAAILAEVGAGDEVIVPSYTFTTSASAFALFGAKVVFVDVNRDTLNIDPEAVAQAITPKTRHHLH